MIKNNKGFGSREILTVSTVCLILAAILLVIAIKSSYGEKYSVMEYNARVFGLNATTYLMENNNDSVSMMELLDHGLFTQVKNPFGGEKYCDTAESRVEYIDEKKYVTLKCGPYLIDHQYIAEESYQIYKVGEWTEKKMSDAQSRVFYNYKMNGSDGFDAYYDQAMFLYAFNKKMNQNYEDVRDIPSRYQVYSKTLYRSKKLIEVVDNKEGEKKS